MSVPGREPDVAASVTVWREREEGSDGGMEPQFREFRGDGISRTNQNSLITPLAWGIERRSIFGGVYSVISTETRPKRKREQR